MYRSKIKDLSKIIASVLSRLEKRIADKEDIVINKKLSKCIRAMMKERGIYVGSASLLRLTACVSEILGIVVNGAYKASQAKLLTAEKLWEHAASHVTSKSGEQCLNRSLMRFLQSLQIGDDPVSMQPLPVIQCKFEAPEEKNVSWG